MAIAARALSIFLALGGAVSLLVAVAVVAGYRPYTGVGGAIIVDAIFGTLVLFAAARLLWLYATKKSGDSAAGSEQIK